MLSFPVFACTEPRSVPAEDRSVVAHSQPMHFLSARDLRGRRNAEPCRGVGVYADPNRRAPACSSAVISVRLVLSPLECVLAAKHRVLPVFSRNTKHSSPLETTLTSHPVCVDSKRLTGILSPLNATLTKNIGGGDSRRSLVSTLCPSPSVAIAVSALSLSSHCSQPPLVPQFAKARNFFTIRGNNSAPRGV